MRKPSVSETIRDLELNQLVEEFKLGEDRVAYLPAQSPLSSRKEALAIIYKEMMEEFGKVGLADAPIEPFDPLDAFVITDQKGRSSIWAASDFDKYKDAYRRYWRGKLSLKWDPHINGEIWHVDHSFNRGRISSALRMRHHEKNEREASVQKQVDIGNDAADGSSKSEPEYLGYVRLFLLPADVNVSWGASAERIRTAEAREAVKGRAASLMVIAKLSGYFPPKNIDDARKLARNICQKFDISNIEIEDMAYLIGHDARGLREVKSIWSMASVDGVAVNAYGDSGIEVHHSAKKGLTRFIYSLQDLVDYTCREGAGLDRAFTAGEAGAIQRVLIEEGATFAAFIHHCMRWPVARIGSCGNYWYGLLLPDGRLADARGVHEYLEIVKEFSLEKGAEVETGGWNLLALTLDLDQATYWPYGNFWMCWKSISCLPPDPFQEVLDAYPNDQSLYNSGLCDSTGDPIPWWQTEQ